MILHRRCRVKGDFSIFSFSGAGLQCCIWPDRKHAATYIQRLPHLFFPQRSLHLFNLLYTLLTEMLLPLRLLRSRLLELFLLCRSGDSWVDREGEEGGEE